MYFCRICGIEYNEDTFRKNTICKECQYEYNKEWVKNNKEKTNQYARDWRRNNPERSIEIGKKSNDKRRRNMGQLPMNENRECPAYLGVHVAEKVLRNVFNNVKQMPFENPGFDFICNKGKKIDVKSACMISSNRCKSPFWVFNINKNIIANYFLFLAFDNRKQLNPLYLWLMPGEIVNTLTQTSISQVTMKKWDKYKLDIENVIKCCDTIKQSQTDVYKEL